MRKRVLSRVRFRGDEAGWDWPEDGPRSGIDLSGAGALLDGRAETRTLVGSGVHTRNGDSIELAFELEKRKAGLLRFGFAGAERAVLTLDLAKRRAALHTTDWTVRQPVATASFTLPRSRTHRLVVEKTEGAGDLVKRATIAATLDGRALFSVKDLNVLPELGVMVSVAGVCVRLREFVHRGVPSGIPEYFHVGGWQTLNLKSIEGNRESIVRGVREAAEAGVRLLVTPETSLTGLHPHDPITHRRKPIQAAERKLQSAVRKIPNAPYVLVGLPVWRANPGPGRREVRYNVSRLYAPDGSIAHDCSKIHSCEDEFWHGYALNEFDVEGVPVSVNVCHDVRYPETWTLPIMFGARLIVHPACGGRVIDSVEALERRANISVVSQHAFYVHTSGTGGSFIVGPQKHKNLLAVSADGRRDNPSFPMVGERVEGLHHAVLRIHDAFGYWPVRSFRASEEVARAYVALYKARGGRRLPSGAQA